MSPLRSMLAFLALTSTVAAAQTPPPPRGMPPRVDIVALLNLDADRAQQVDAIMQAAHARMKAARDQIGRPTDDATRSLMHTAMQAIRQDTDTQLATVLTADELAKVHAAMPQRPPR
jgi:periplasmic protein CpxP/Spy